MRIFDARRIGLDQGSRVLFSDFQDGGEMWTGRGAREKRLWVKFSRSFHDAPSVFVGFSMWDLDAQTNPRADITSENITAQGFDLVFRTWSDTRVARIRADWMAIGPVAFEDDWNVGS